ncbi:tyrosine-type recombinase/integrase [Actinocrinis sp.]|uniref:tyrosine-type recombinase/integrase n=1 Tax=Actinocrinis sp. TaxID=1920516 RepID=UPI002D70147D|nr:tyrosine-type recombinase/integrase [Actinocrinis sp.]HZP55018.1 tyrosine-type recombinase/integrase [Actinocrinis sp.]
MRYDADETPDPYALTAADDLVISWQISLRAAKKSPPTIRTYCKNVRLYLAWCREADATPNLGHLAVTAYLADVCDTRSGQTARNHLVALRSFARWAAKENETGPYDLAEIDQPKVDQHVTEPFTPDELGALLKACAGKRFMDVRDTAIQHILLDSGGRAMEIVGMQLEDVRLADGLALVRGKGAKDRYIPLSDRTCEALDKYLRVRRRHPQAHLAQLWLGEKGRAYGYHGMYRSLKARGEMAGVANVYPHRYRHTFADRWLDKGGTEGGLMRIAGWSDPAMVQRYSQARATRRALTEARRLNVGEL